MTNKNISRKSCFPKTIAKQNPPAFIDSCRERLFIISSTLLSPTGPVPAVRNALAAANLSLADMDLCEVGRVDLVCMLLFCDILSSIFFENRWVCIWNSSDILFFLVFQQLSMLYCWSWFSKTFLVFAARVRAVLHRSKYDLKADKSAQTRSPAITKVSGVLWWQSLSCA